MGSGKKSFCMLSLSTVLPILLMVLSCVKTLAGNNAGAAFTIWPDTGQTRCSDNERGIPCPAEGEPFYGQDAQYQGPQRSYTKLGYGGVELPDSATIADGWIMTRDNVTGLIWEIKTNKDGTRDYTNPHDADNTYTWCDHNPDTNGGSQGKCSDGNDTEDFINMLNTEHFGGFSDWRLPTVKELSTLTTTVTFLNKIPSIDTTYFPNTLWSAYWSSTTYANYSDGAWHVGFYGGVVFYGHKDEGRYVRAVRSGPAPFHSFFQDNHDGTVTDTVTGLMWQKCSMGQTYNAAINDCEEVTKVYTWQEALEICEDLEFAGYDDWRLPNRNELQSIVDYSTTIDFPNTESSCYWSSTTAILQGLPTDAAYFVIFNYGAGVVNVRSKGNYCYVRCVRSRQGGLTDDSVTLTISKCGTGSGTVTSSDGKISCSTDCAESYDKGSSVTLTATPGIGSEFIGWGGECEFCGNSQVCNVVMNSPLVCTAEFDLSDSCNKGDVNCDGRVDVVDAILIARKVVGLPVSGWCTDR